ncbi:MAG: hypothetical protein ABIJ30_11135 [bacterium]
MSIGLNYKILSLVEKKKISRLFPDCTFDFHRITIAPPITRLLAPYSWLLCYLLEKLKLLNTHYLIAIWRVKRV